MPPSTMTPHPPPPKTPEKSGISLDRPQSAPSGARDSDIWSRLSKSPAHHNTPHGAATVDARLFPFKPTVSPSANMATDSSPFLERVPKYVERYREVHAGATPLSKLTFTFRPSINPSPRKTASARPKSSFLRRVQSDLVHRAEVRQQLDAAVPFSFAPELVSRRRPSSASSRAAANTATFLDRLNEDLERREENARDQKRQAEHVPFTFTPRITQVGRADRQEVPSFSRFLGRMVADISEREDQFAERAKEMTKKFVPHAPKSARRPHSARR